MTFSRDFVLACLAGASSLAALADTRSTSPTALESPAMFSSPSRPSSPEVPPIEHQGIRYEQDRHDGSAGDQPGGYLVAIDAKTGARLWRLKVYQILGAPGFPAASRYFRSMQLKPDGNALEIENEAGGVYRVDLSARSSTQVAGPAETAAPALSSKPKPTPQ